MISTEIKACSLPTTANHHAGIRPATVEAVRRTLLEHGSILDVKVAQSAERLSAPFECRKAPIACRALSGPPIRLQLRVANSAGVGERRFEVTVGRYSTVQALVKKQFEEELSDGFRVRMMHLGRQLKDSESWDHMSDGAVLQCYLLQVPREDVAASSCEASLEMQNEQGKPRALSRYPSLGLICFSIAIVAAWASARFIESQ